MFDGRVHLGPSLHHHHLHRWFQADMDAATHIVAMPGTPFLGLLHHYTPNPPGDAAQSIDQTLLDVFPEAAEGDETMTLDFDLHDPTPG
jgi:hypothetical protein